MDLKFEADKFNFDTDTKEHSLRNAYWLARASQIAYDGIGDIKKTVKDWGFAESEFVFLELEKKKITAEKYLETVKYDPQAFITGNDDMLMLVFRGTQEIKDWITNAQIAHTDTPGGRVHKGFLSALDLIWTDNKSSINIGNYIQKERRGRSLWIAGHSLGGALAVLTSVKLNNENKELCNGVYTFGQPRVGDENFAKSFNDIFLKESFRYVNNNDIVPRILFESNGYRDIGTLKYFDERQYLRDEVSLLRGNLNQIEYICEKNYSAVVELWEGLKSNKYTDSVEYSRMINEFKTIRENFKNISGKYDLVNALSDHRIKNYISCIYKALS